MTSAGARSQVVFLEGVPGMSEPPVGSGTDAGTSERRVLARAFARLDPLALGIAAGAVFGTALCLATLVLIMQGGSRVGLHLNRLGQYLPGYVVTWPGAAVGLVEGFALGFAAGALLALAWNAYHRLFVSLVVARERVRDVRRELQEL